MHATLIVLVGALLAGGCRGAGERAGDGSEWPERAVRLIVPVGAGSGVDLAARLYATELAEHWGRPVVVENRPGAEGIVGVTAFTAAEDGHTLLFAPSGLVASHSAVLDSLPYDPERDVVPISTIGSTVVAIAAHPDLPASTLGELVTLMRSGGRRYYWTGAPGPPDIIFGAFQKQEGIAMTRVAYTEIAEAMRDLVAGRIQVMVIGLMSIAPQVKSGRIRLLAVANPSRTPAAPTVPTVAEAGYPELTYDGNFGIFGWRGMPEALRQRIATDITRAADDPALRSRLATVGLTARASTPEAFDTAVAGMRARLRAIAGLAPGRAGK